MHATVSLESLDSMEHELDYGEMELEEPEYRSDRRSSARKIVSLIASIQLPNGTVLSGRTVDVSNGGLSVLTPDQLSIGDECEVNLEFSLFGSERKFRIVGRVCYSVAETGKGYRSGMQFVQMDLTTAAFISAALK